MLKCSSLCKVCLQELKTGNQLQRQQLPSAQVKQNENSVQLGEAKCRLASKQILHFGITVRASSETLLRWSLLMCINPVLLHPCALFTKNSRSSGLQPWKQCHYYSCAPNQAHHVIVWGYPRRNSGHNSSLFPRGEGNDLRCSECRAPAVTARTVLPAPPAGGLFPILPGTCLHFPAQLETVQGWMELAHGYRATICSGFPRLKVSFCLEIKCRWDLRTLWVPGQMGHHT